MGESRRRNGEKAESILAKVEKRNTGSLRLFGGKEGIGQRTETKGSQG